jgi:hypothetical protein
MVVILFNYQLNTLLYQNDLASAGDWPDEPQRKREASTLPEDDQQQLEASKALELAAAVDNPTSQRFMQRRKKGKT